VLKINKSVVANSKISKTAFCDSLRYSSFEINQNSTNGIDIHFSCGDESDVISIKVSYSIADTAEDHVLTINGFLILN
jgi:hypothetical protein